MMFCHTHTFSCHNKDDDRYKEHLKDISEKNLESCKWEDDYDPTIHNKPFTNQSRQNTSQTSSSLIYDFAKSKIKKLVVSDSDSSQVFAIIQNNGHLETLDLSSWKAKSWLRYAYHKESGDNHSEDQYTNALILIKSQAIHGNSKRETIYNRIAMVHDTIYYDLATPDWKIVKITENSVDILDYDEKMPIFVRTQSQLPQVLPKFSEKNTLDDLVKLLRIPQKDTQIFKAHLISMFVEAFPIPIMAITGEHGSIKSTLSGTVKIIVDPAVDKKKSLSKKPENIILGMFNRYAICFDNISKINQEVSDTLCTAITGAGDSKRALYTNSEEIIYTFKRKIILNGIAPSMNFPDLLDRTITYETIPVPDEQRITEEEFERRLHEILCNVVGQIFQTLSKVLGLYKSVKSELIQLPRMADFTMFGECISRVLGYEPHSFTNMYNTRIQDNSLEVAQTYPIIPIMEELVMDGKYEKEVGNFYNEIKIIAGTQKIDIESTGVEFPQGANHVKGHLKRLMPDLRKLGILVDIDTYKKRDGRFKRGCSIIHISRIEETGLFSEKTSLPSLPSLPKPIQAQMKTITGRDAGRDTLVKNIPSLPYIAKMTPVGDTGWDGRDGKDSIQE